MFEVDEILLLDISASQKKREPNMELIYMLAEECWVPLTYGGGITRLKQIEKIILAGVEKVVLGSSAVYNLSFLTEAAREFGSQSIVASVDVKKRFFGGYEVRYLSGTLKVRITPAERALQLQEAGAGEILLQSVDRDGEMNGYDLELIEGVTTATDLPVIACSGAANRDDLVAPIKMAGASASAAGSLFVFSGIERGVVINFPERAVLEKLLAGA